MAKEKRLIDADALRCEIDGCSFESGYDAGKVLIMIAEAPTVDAVEVVHGRWVDNMVRNWHCSVCGKKVPRQVYFDGYCYDDKLNYCPNCGAKMDGGNEDEL